MKTYLTAYIATALAFLCVDAIWLSTMTSQLYRPLLGDILRESFALAPAVFFYLIYVAGIVFFAIRPAFAGGGIATALLHGAAFGFCAYATYDLTNHATLKDWPLAITLADLAWGTFVTATSAALGFAITRTVVGQV